jgi:cell division protein FtsW (lipid II flippase)
MIPGIKATIQPAEFAKLAVVMLMAVGIHSYTQKLREYDSRKRSVRQAANNFWIAPLLFAFLCAGLVAKQPDMDTAAVIIGIAVVMMFIGGVNWKVIAGLVTSGIVLFAVVMSTADYRRERLAAHLHRNEAQYRDGSAMQTNQSVAALSRGGAGGTGFTQGTAKARLPEATSDFVMTTVGEEFGFVGFTISFSIVGGIVWRLLYLARRTKDTFARMMLCGVATWIGLQTMLNVLMSNGTLWVMGIPMPFYSDGGSSLIALWLALGMAQGAFAGDLKQEAKNAADRYRWRHRRSRLSGA